MNWVRIGPIDERWFLIKKFPLGRNEPKTPGGTPTSQIRGREKYILISSRSPTLPWYSFDAHFKDKGVNSYITVNI